MRRFPYKKYLLLVGVLFLLLSLPTFFIHSIRTKMFAVFYSAMKLSKHKFKDPRVSQKIEQLESENHLLRIEIGKLRMQLEQMGGEEPFHAKLTQARVIFRDPASWSSSLWIDVGENNPCVQKNSPVIVGRSLVGVVDYVGKKQSRVRLITDVGMKPSVRAVRGAMQNSVLVDHIAPLLRHLSHRKDLPLSKDELFTLGCLLTRFKERLLEETQGFYLAKGILQGSGAPLWRSLNHSLRGIGFNYDFPDECGPLTSLPLIQVNDLLVTTGLDGVFPSGLCVAEVKKIFPLREGAYTYDIEAVPVVGNLDLLQTLFVIPPLGYDNEDQPNQIFELIK